MRIGTTELLVVLLVALIVFGPKTLPKLGTMFGKTVKSFKQGLNGDEGSESKKAAAPEEHSA